MTLVRSCQTLSCVSKGAILIYVGTVTLDPLKGKVAPNPSITSQGSQAAIERIIWTVSDAIPVEQLLRARLEFNEMPFWSATFPRLSSALGSAFLLIIWNSSCHSRSNEYCFAC